MSLIRGEGVPVTRKFCCCIGECNFVVLCERTHPFLPHLYVYKCAFLCRVTSRNILKGDKGLVCSSVLQYFREDKET